MGIFNFFLPKPKQEQGRVPSSTDKLASAASKCCAQCQAGRQRPAEAGDDPAPNPAQSSRFPSSQKDMDMAQNDSSTRAPTASSCQPDCAVSSTPGHLQTLSDVISDFTKLSNAMETQLTDVNECVVRFRTYSASLSTVLRDMSRTQEQPEPKSKPEPEPKLRRRRRGRPRKNTTPLSDNKERAQPLKRRYRRRRSSRLRRRQAQAESESSSDELSRT